MPPDARRPLTLCADDFGLAAGIDDAIAALIADRRLSATSCIVLGERWPDAARLLASLGAGVEIGLHFTLTDHPPAGSMPALAPAGRLPPLGRLLALSLTGRLDRAEIEAEFGRQIDRFAAAVGRLPDFVDGHQHVHQFPMVRDAVLAVFAERLRGGGAWLRYPASPARDSLVHRVALRRVAVINLLGLGFRRRGRRAGIPGNGTFRGVRDIAGEPPFEQLFQRFVRRLGERPLIMCHPGNEGDPFAADVCAGAEARRDEYRFLASPRFPEILAAHGLVLRNRDDPIAGPLTPALP